MNLSHLHTRQTPPIPWNDPGFSRRMLREHLDQSHDMASRTSPVIDQHVDWIADVASLREGSRVLDIACGPGLYTSRLAKRGCECVGIDFAPASIEYARQCAKEDGLEITYKLGDVRTATSVKATISLCSFSASSTSSSGRI